MSSRDIVLELIERGLSRKAIGSAIGRNDRLIGYVEKGHKPGANLEPALAELRDRLAAGEAVSRRPAPVAHAPARRTVGDRVARVRRPRTITGRGWSSTTLRKQATRSGGHSIMHPLIAAAERGESVAATVGLNRLGTVNGTSGGRSVGSHASQIELGSASDVLDAVADDYDGDFTAYVMDQLVNAGYVSVTGDPAGAADSIELRSY